MIGLLMFFGFVALVGGGILLYNVFDCEWALLLIVLGAFALFFFLIALPISRVGNQSRIQAYYAIRDTIEAAREDATSIENYAMQQKIIQVNQILAKARYWNERFDWFWVDEYAELEPLR